MEHKIWKPASLLPRLPAGYTLPSSLAFSSCYFQWLFRLSKPTKLSRLPGETCCPLGPHSSVSAPCCQPPDAPQGPLWWRLVPPSWGGSSANFSTNVYEDVQWFVKNPFLLCWIQGKLQVSSFYPLISLMNFVFSWRRKMAGSFGCYSVVNNNM